jgi:lysophospholipase L1-like esterase
MHHQLARSVRRALTSVAALTCVSLLAVTFAAAAQATKNVTGKTSSSSPSMTVTPSTPITRGSGYLAIGDSVSFGYMEPTVVPAPGYTSASNFVGFPEVIASDLHLKLANAACPGETSASLINDKAQSFGCETSPSPTSPAYRATFPLHVKYTGSQLSYAVKYLKANANVRLVTLMIGANDFFLCEATTADACQSPIEQAGVVGALEKNVKKIISAVRGTAHYNGQLVLVDYYDTPAVPGVEVQELDHFINEGGRGFHVRIANAFNTFAAASVHSGANNCTAGLLTQLSTGGCGVHPSLAGQTLLASTVMRQVRLG